MFVQVPKVESGGVRVSQSPASRLIDTQIADVMEHRDEQSPLLTGLDAPSDDLE